MASLYSLEIVLPTSQAEEAAAFLADAAPQGWEEQEQEQETLFRVFFTESAVAEDVAAAAHRRFPGLARKRLTEEEDRDWTHGWRDFFQPIVAGSYEVLPPWLADGASEGFIHIIIEPKMAFGTGHHATTALCLSAISDLAREGAARGGMRFLDMGTGTGILGIALCKQGLTGLGADIDAQAVACATENLARNGCLNVMELQEGSLDAIPADARYEVVVANILAGPLAAMAPGLVEALAPGGVLLLSGILESQQQGVALAYVAQGLPVPRITAMGEWVCLRFDAPASTP